MDDRQREIDRRIRRAQRHLLLKGLWEYKLLFIGGMALFGGLGAGMAFNATPDRIEATLLATPLDDGNVVTTRKGAQYRHERVRLENGATIVLDIPGAEPTRHDAPMKVEIHRRDLGPMHQVTYRFAGYASASPQT